MKRIKNVKICPEDFELINRDPVSPRQLYRLNAHDQYAIFLMDRPNRVFKFEAQVLSEILNDLGGGVQDVTVVEFKAPERGDAEEIEWEIRLHLENGLMVSINHNDEVRRCDLLGYRAILEEALAIPVSELWYCDGLFEFLWLTPELAEVLKPYILKFSAAEVFRRLWCDCQREIHAGQAELEFSVAVDTEFGDLIMTRYSDRTILRSAP